jgi:hypothetical protein
VGTETDMRRVQLGTTCDLVVEIILDKLTRGKKLWHKLIQQLIGSNSSNAHLEVEKAKIILRVKKSPIMQREM